MLVFERLGSIFYARGRLNLFKGFKKRRKTFAQRYLTASDEDAMGALTRIVASEPFAKSKERHIDCSLTPLLNRDQSQKDDELTHADEVKTAGDFEWPIFEDRTYSRHLKHFMFSFKNIYSENINSSNLMFITGPTKSGKSAFLRQGINSFAKADGAHRPVVFHFDFDECNSMITFDVFLSKFETMIVNTLVSNRATLFGEDSGQALDRMLQVATRFYDKNLLEQGIAHSVNRVLTSGQGHTYAYSIDPKQNKASAKALQSILDQYKGKDYKKTLFIKDFAKTASLLKDLTTDSEFLEQWSEDDRVFAAALRLFHDAIIAKELNRRHASYVLSNNQRDGIDCLNFFFDLINDCAGYSDKYYKEIGAGKMNYASMVKKYREHMENPEESELLADKHPHCLMVIEGVHRLFRMYRSRSLKHLSVDYLDTLILRLNTGCNGKWYRNHFPVILETNMSQYFNEQIYNDMQQSEFTFPTIEFTGFETQTKVANLSHIFNKDQVEAMDQNLGKSIYLTHVATELVKRRTEDLTVTELLNANDTAFLKIKRQFENRINSLFSHPLLGDILDTQDVDFAVMQALEEFVKVQRHNRTLSAHSIYARNEVLQTPIFKAMFDLNIIWKSKYYDNFGIEQQLYVNVVEDWLDQRKEGMNGHEKILYWLYKKKNSQIKFSKKSSGVGAANLKMLSKKHALKADAQWDLASLYYDSLPIDKQRVIPAKKQSAESK